ncbi:related to tripeptidyl-peptidase I [Rhynchosporium secalis]|uniref:tripeptidyl-peptidase II n=1 Tax=Rhynchosporium secalis TaxID=38038 RepID=A0A1E1M2I9_RHYSE|nr:related to tripeptidyl-peptidase I [Rhynchosporium secalis]
MLGASILLTIAITAEAVLATPVQARTSYSVKEKHWVPRRWMKMGRAPSEKMLSLQIGVKQGNFEELKRHLYEVSDPDHIRHGHHLSHDEVNELMKPSDEALYLLHEWLEANGVDRTSYSPAKDWVNIQISVSTAERLLDTEYHVYKHDDGTEIYRAPTWSLPKHLHEHIDAIQPTTSFMRAIEKREVAVDMTIPWPYPGINEARSPELKKVCTINGTTPDCFATLYKTKGYVQKAAGRNQIGFNNFLGDIPIRPDTKLFLQKYRPEAVSGAADYKFVSIDGGPQQDTGLTPAQATQRISREGNLDVQTIIGITYPMPVVAYTTGGQTPVIPNPPVTGPPENEPFLAWVNYVLSQETIPQVISTSYADDEQTVPLNYAKRVCNGFAQLGARGITLLFATGDTGVGSVAGNEASFCITNDGKNTSRFLSKFPASCPYVTAVGATQGFEPETSAMTPDGAYGPDGKRRGLFVSASGFSEYFPRPSYQDSVVPAYVNSMRGEHTGLFNPNGRAFPDLAAQGQLVKSLWNSTERVASGTSASAPLMAGVLALVNDALISSGRPTLGFLNPWLYKRGSEAFNDITQGLNGGCNTTGFPTIEGWDTVTGFGTPDFRKILKTLGLED